MSEYGIEYRDRYSTMSDSELDNTIRLIYRDQHKMGEVMLMGHLRSQGIHVQRKRLRDAIHWVDPEGVEERKAKGIKRRFYEVPYPNFIWHLDGNHKLIRYRLLQIFSIEQHVSLVHPSMYEQITEERMLEFGWQCTMPMKKSNVPCLQENLFTIKE